MQSVSSRIWTRIVVFNSYDDNHYTTGTSMIKMIIIREPVVLWTMLYRLTIEWTSKKAHRVTSTWTLLENKKSWEDKGVCDTNYNWCTRNDHQRPGRARKRRTSQDHPDYSIVDISQNTKKSPGDLKRLAVTRTAEKDHQLRLTGKKLARGNMITIIGSG